MPPNTTHFLWLICLRFARQMARDVRSKLHTYGAGDPDRAMALADLVIQDPLMQLAIAKHMEQHQGIDIDIVDCIGNLLSSLTGVNHRGRLRPVCYVACMCVCPYITYTDNV